jgi:hypothetical protein
MIPLAEETSFDYETVRELAALPALMERAALLRERGPNLFLIPERYLAAGSERNEIYGRSGRTVGSPLT